MNRALAALVFASSAWASTPTPVRIDIVEALSPKDTTSSLRFQTEFDEAIKLGKIALDPKLKSCGYSLEIATRFFDANDPLQAKEAAEKATSAGSWVILGPRRSNHYILLAKGSGRTPTVSLMASATEIADLGALHTSLSPNNKEMARAAAVEAQKRTTRKASYVAIVSDDCVTCKDFETMFDTEAAMRGLRKIGRYGIQGESPDLSAAINEVGKTKPSIVLVPNFSRTAAKVIGVVSTALPHALFVGSDGWGDSNFGFMQNDAGIQKATGITVRGFPPAEVALHSFPLGRDLISRNVAHPASGPGIAILKALDTISNTLCSKKPKTREAFADVFESKTSRDLTAPFGVSIYDLKKSNIIYSKRASLR